LDGKRKFTMAGVTMDGRRCCSRWSCPPAGPTATASGASVTAANVARMRWQWGLCWEGIPPIRNLLLGFQTASCVSRMINPHQV
jgi:hypothetical protein